MFTPCLCSFCEQLCSRLENVGKCERFQFFVVLGWLYLPLVTWQYCIIINNNTLRSQIVPLSLNVGALQREQIMFLVFGANTL